MAMLPANSCVAYKNMIKQVVNCWRKTVVIICQGHQCVNWGSVYIRAAPHLPQTCHDLSHRGDCESHIDCTFVCTSTTCFEKICLFGNVL